MPFILRMAALARTRQQVGTVIYLSHVRRDETGPRQDHSGPEAATVAGQVALKGPANNPPPPAPHCRGQKGPCFQFVLIIVQELCESRGGHPGLSVLTSLLVSVDIKLY